MNSPIQVMDLLQWVVIAFAAGFIGFFGKSLGKTILDFFHRRGPGRDGDAMGISTRNDSPVENESDRTFDPGGYETDGEKAAKIMKKQQKALLKQEKKRLKDSSGK